MKKFDIIIERLLNTKTSVIFIFILILFLGISILSPGKGLSPNQTALFGTASFLFSVYLGFTMNNQRTRFNDLFSVDRSETSYLYSIYMLSRDLPKKDFEKIRSLIDDYLVGQIDYLLADYQKTDNAFTSLVKYCVDLDVSTEKAKFAKDKIADLLPQEQEKRFQMQSLIKESVSKAEWVTLTGLYAVTLHFILSFEINGIIAYLAVSILATAATLLLIILAKYSRLTWRAQEKIWMPLERLFIQMDLLPYYCEPVIKNGQVKPTAGIPVRVAKYTRPYPDFRDKKVEIVTF